MVGQDAGREAVSSALFNNSAFVAVVVAADEAVADAYGPLLTTRLIASRTGLSDSVVRPVVQRLVRAELLGELPRSSARGARYLSITHPEACSQLMALIHALPGQGRGTRMAVSRKHA